MYLAVVLRRIALERRGARQHLEEEDAEGPHLAHEAIPRVLHHLRAHVLCSSADAVRLVAVLRSVRRPVTPEVTPKPRQWSRLAYERGC